MFDVNCKRLNKLRYGIVSLIRMNFKSFISTLDREIHSKNYKFTDKKRKPKKKSKSVV